MAAGFSAKAEDNIYQNLKKFNIILNSALKNHVEENDSEKLVEAAIKGMLKELDPHSVYYSVEDMNNIRENMQGSFVGVGITYSMISDTLNILKVSSGGPSEKAGLKSGDKLIEIDGKKAIGLDRDELQKLLRGTRGTEVTLGVLRDSPKINEFEVIRDVLPIRSVDAAFILDGTDIGYINVNKFRENTYVEFHDSLMSLKKQGMRKLIFDLRGNPGGIFSQGNLIADEFLESGKTIVETKGRRAEFDEVIKSTSKGDFKNMPLIVLINAGSASASEIISGAIQDLDRGLIIGETSYGKGLVQRQYPLFDGSAFRITIAKYYTPSGRCIQRSYADEDKYRSLEGRLDLEDGDELANAIDEIRKNSPKDSLPPIYQTVSGREVLGGGGINPDHIVKSDSLTDLTMAIRRENLFNIYYLTYRNELDYTDFNTFRKEFIVDDIIWNKFKSLAEFHKIEWNDDEFNADKDYLGRFLKSVIARNIWDSNESTIVFLPDSKIIKEAVHFFPQAVAIAGFKDTKELDSGDDK